MSTTIIDKMRYQIKWLTQQVECIKEKGCLCFSFETDLSYNPETGELSATFTDDSTRTVVIPPANVSWGNITGNINNQTDLINLLDSKPEPTGLEAIDEGNGVGWRLIGKDPVKHFPIGSDATDLSIGRWSKSGASGSGAFSIGFGNASGYASFAGANGVASDSYAFAHDGIASGRSSVAIGLGTIAPSFGETSLGNYVTEYTPLPEENMDINTNRLFVIGNGGSYTGIEGLTRSDAFTILKNGQVGIDIDNFEVNTTGEKLQVNGLVKSDVTIAEIDAADNRVVPTKEWVQANSTGISSVVAGTGIAVDDSDPENPVVSSTITTPTLQQVTNQGNTTSNPMIINNYAVSNGFVIQGGLNSTMLGATLGYDLSRDLFRFNPKNPGIGVTANPAFFDFNSITDTLGVTYIFPDKSGTVALLDDISGYVDNNYIPTSEKAAPNGVATLDSNGKLITSQVPNLAITDIIIATETTVADFATNNVSYTFEKGDVIILNSGTGNFYMYNGAPKNNVSSYSQISSTQIDWSQLTNIPSNVQNAITSSYTGFDSRYVNVGGDTMTGNLTAPTANLGDLSISGQVIERVGGGIELQASNNLMFNIDKGDTNNNTRFIDFKTGSSGTSLGRMYATGSFDWYGSIQAQDYRGLNNNLLLSQSGSNNIFIGDYNGGTGQISLRGSSNPTFYNGTQNTIWHSGIHRSDAQNDNRYAIMNDVTQNLGQLTIRTDSTTNRGLRLLNNSTGQSSFLYMDDSNDFNINNSSASSRRVYINKGGSGGLEVGGTATAAGFNIRNGSNTGTISASLTSNRVWNMPDIHGTVAMMGSFPNNSGIFSVDGEIQTDSLVITETSNPPASATAPGTAGEIRVDSNYIYVCVATSTWKRTPLSTW